MFREPSYFNKLKNASKRLNILFGTLAVFILIAATILTLSQHEWANKVNQWQMEVMGDHKYFPVLTIFVFALPPLLVLLPLKMWFIHLELKKKK